MGRESPSIQTQPLIDAVINAVIDAVIGNHLYVFEGHAMFVKFGIPLIFLILWSTGFVGAKYGLPYAEPFTFLAIRMTLNLLVLLALLPFFRVSWPKHPMGYVHLGLVGLLIHGLYLGGIFSAIHYGVLASVTAIIVGLQPLLTAVFALIWLNESMSKWKLFGLILGFIGIVLVISEPGVAPGGAYKLGIVLCVASLFGISIGTIYQKKFCTDYDLLPGIWVQFAANSIFMWALAFAFETREVQWTTQFVLTLGWLVLALSIGAVLLLMWLIRQGEAGGVASLFYLVPPLVAIETWFLFGERFGLVGVVGIACCVIGVALVLNASSKREKSSSNPGDRENKQ